MPRVVSVRFRETGKSYHFDPAGFDLMPGDHVIVQTVHGPEFAHVTESIREIPADKLPAELRPVLRMASEEDLEKNRERRRFEREASAACQERIEDRRLDMSLADCEYIPSTSRLIFYFTAEGRVDFRELVKDLAAKFRMRIELRQIGVRDEARQVGGLAVCGRELCCTSFLPDFVPVSIRMAKEQNLSMNPTKISGMCGRLMCCLKYEQAAYEDANRRMPRPGSIVQTPEGRGMVMATHVLREVVRVRLDRHSEQDDLSLFRLDEIEILSRAGKSSRKGRIQPAPPVRERDSRAGDGGRNGDRDRKEPASGPAEEPDAEEPPDMPDMFDLPDDPGEPEGAASEDPGGVNP